MAKSINTDIYKYISENTGIQQYKVKLVLLFFARRIITEMCAGRKFPLLSIGTFCITHKKGAYNLYQNQHEKKISTEIYYPRFKFSRTVGEYIKKNLKIIMPRGETLPGNNKLSERDVQLLDALLFS